MSRQPLPRVRPAPTTRAVPAPIYVRISTYCRLYDVSRNTAYKWLDAGLIAGLRIGRTIRVRNLPPCDQRPSAA